jgi:lipopolysaccharide transport system ATP-binding protein
MTKAEIRSKFDEIVAFAEIEKFIDTPVKRYSSGMYVRLAFAVAAHLEPEILIVDEVLAVGDVEFQRKCLGKMKDVATGGRTVLFVSHQMGAVMNLCSRALLLEHGNLTFSGETVSVVDHYMTSSRSSSPRARLAQCRFLRSAGFANAKGGLLRAAFPVGGFAQVEIEFRLPEASRKPVAGIVGRRAGTGETVFGANSRSSGQPDLGRPASAARVEVQMGPLNLVPGHYLLDVWVGHDHEDLEVSEGLLELEILDNDPQGTGRPIMTQFGPCFVPMRYEARDSF